ncbi:MAG: PIG-L family deacetylase [Candidatus Calescibacterium sp.]|nr:PIG-L family deacetylase [Candidatus Calescibacterium sp.]MCX7733530.1 PIG-L family deacetylase [bacterium]MDW8087243.1 PIG-L family deacetylase [Candidatus Calescibacterium sp.]
MSLNVLALGAHPDDVEFGCGGTLFKLSKLGAKIYIFVATSGEVGGEPEVRISESKKAAEFLNAEIIFGGFKDTFLSYSRELIQKIELVVKQVSPHIIFVNYYEDTHQDHYALSKAAITATRYSRNLLFYEVPSTSASFKPDVFTDISDVLDEKLKLLLCHESQVYKVNIGNLDILQVARSTANFRGIQARCEYAEGFSPYRFQFLEILEILGNGALKNNGGKY